MNRGFITAHILVVFLDKQVFPVASFPEFCFTSLRVASPLIPADESATRRVLFMGLSNSAKLYLASASGTAQLLATNVNSFCVASGFVIFTTAAHEVHFAPLAILLS